MNEFFTGCPHFGHHNIMKYCNRPFKTVAEMNEALMQNIHEVVKPKDALWIIGDVCFGNFTNVRDVVRQLPTRNVSLILGNHDRLTKQKYKDAGFNHVKDYHEISRNIGGKKRKIVMFHYPIDSWNAKYRGAYHLHSHTHNSVPDDPTMNRMNVGVDMTAFKPVSLEEVEQFMSLKETNDG